MPTSEATSTAKIPERILLIEDNEEAAFLVENSLGTYAHGRYTLEWAKSLDEGQKRLAGGGVDLVLLDLGLPDSSGPQTYESIRAAAPEVPVLVLTGDAAEETESTITAQGGEDYLVKDQVSGPLLLRAVQSVLYSSKLKRRV